MRKCDVNGNVVAKSRSYLSRVIRNMNEGRFTRDGYGRMMVHTGDGGTIFFWESEEPRIASIVAGRLAEELR